MTISVPLVLKIGRVTENSSALQLLHAVAPHVKGLAMTNSIAARVRQSTGELLFDGQPRGNCGDVIREASVGQVRLFRDLVTERGMDLDLIGVGGISKSVHVESYLSAGASTVGVATAAMLRPDIALCIRSELIGSRGV